MSLKKLLFILLIATQTHSMHFDPEEAQVQKQVIFQNLGIAFKNRDNHGLYFLFQSALALIEKYDLAPDQMFVDGYPLIYIAVAMQSLDNIMSMIKLGADVNAKNPHGRSSLMAAADIGSGEICELLITNGADPHMLSASGKKAIYFAKKKSSAYKFLKKYEQTEPDILEIRKYDSTKIKDKNIFNAIENYTQEGDYNLLLDLMFYYKNNNILENILREKHKTTHDTPLEFAIKRHRFAAAHKIFEEILASNIFICPSESANALSFLSRCKDSYSIDENNSTRYDYICKLSSFMKNNLGAQLYLKIKNKYSEDLPSEIIFIIAHLTIELCEQEPWLLEGFAKHGFIASCAKKVKKIWR